MSVAGQRVHSSHQQSTGRHLLADTNGLGCAGKRPLWARLGRSFRLHPDTAHGSLVVCAEQQGGSAGGCVLALG